MKLSFNDVVACTPTGSTTSKELFADNSDCGFKKDFMKLGLLKKELILVFLFCKY